MYLWEMKAEVFLQPKITSEVFVHIALGLYIVRFR